MDGKREPHVPQRVSRSEPRDDLHMRVQQRQRNQRCLRDGYLLQDFRWGFDRIEGPLLFPLVRFVIVLQSPARERVEGPGPDRWPVWHSGKCRRPGPIAGACEQPYGRSSNQKGRDIGHCPIFQEANVPGVRMLARKGVGE